MAMNKMIRVEVVYAGTQRQQLMALEVEEGSTIEMAIQQSGILMLFPEIDLSKQKTGVFSKQRKLFDVVQANDRIEIYRPLIIEPKEARRKKAKNE